MLLIRFIVTGDLADLQVQEGVMVQSRCQHCVMWSVSVCTLRSVPCTLYSDTVPCHGEVKNSQELLQCRLVHDIHERHFHNQKVQHRATGSNRSKLLSGLIDFLLCLGSNHEFLLDFLGCRLCGTQHRDERFVVHQGSWKKERVMEEAMTETGKGRREEGRKEGGREGGRKE